MAVDQQRNDQRRLQVYVEISSRRKSVAEREPASDTTSDISMSTTSPPPRKRRLSQPDVNASIEVKRQKLAESNTNTIPPKPAVKGADAAKDKEVSKDDLKLPKKTTIKRAKPTTSAKPRAVGTASLVKPSNASEEFPNGHLYCHQCNKKRDATQVINCTEATRKCKTKYCKPCLANRYGEDIDQIRKSPPSGRGKSKMPYTFKCPRCKGVCNCRTCRRAQGLEPTGNLTNAARKVGISAAELLDANPDQKGILPGQGQERKRAKAAASAAADTNKTTSPGASTSKPAEKLPPKPKPKPIKPRMPIIQPTWTRLSNVPREVTLEHLEERMFIREFMVRFSSLMDKEAKTHLDELGEVVGDGSVDWVVTEVRPKKGRDTLDIPLVSWVSEKCMRSVVLGLLGMYTEDATGPTRKSLQTALKEIKNSSANMTKIWTTLASLRHAHPKDFTYPDPLPPPTTMPVYNTRRGALTQDSIPVGHSAQLTQIVLDLIDGLTTSGSKTLKSEIDKGINEGKDITKLGKEAITRENERWAKEKVRLGTTKPPRAFRDAHNIRIDDLEKAQHTLVSCFTSRFSSLGRDDEGRRYFAFSPSVNEREAALDIISDDLEEVGTAPKRSTGSGRNRRGTAFVAGGAGAMDEAKREELWNWNWFVAVWGRRPEGAVVAPDPHCEDGDATDDDDDDEEGEGEDEHRGGERWWAFWRPEDIRNLSRWIAHAHGLGHEDDNHDAKERERAKSSVGNNGTSNGLLHPSTGPSTAASSTADAFSDRASTTNLDHGAMEVDDDHETDTHESGGEGSPLTDIDDSGDESGNKKLLDAPPNGKPSRRAVKELVSALGGYAQLLEWRVKRGERERKARQKD